MSEQMMMTADGTTYRVPPKWWFDLRAALDCETRADAPALAEHVRAIRNHVGTARHILGQDGRYVTTAERMVADDELYEAIARADLLLIALNGGCP